MKTQKQPIIDMLIKHVTKENIEKISAFLEKASIKVSEFMDKNGQLIEQTLDNANSTIINNTPKLCDIVETENISVDSLKEIITGSNIKGFTSVALLKDGYNVKEEKHMFYMMFLDSSNNQLKDTNVIFITSDNVDVKIKNNFSEKDLLILK